MHQLISKKNKIIIYLLLLFILSTTRGKFLENQNSYSSKINQINIVGLSSPDISKIYNELNNLFYKNILLVGKDEIQKVISKYNIIEEYSIKKIYPSTININIKPIKFIARLSSSDQLVGVNGKLIEDKENNEVLPYIFGEFNSQDFLNFKKNIVQSKFTFTEFKTLYFFPSNRWDILTNDDILIKLPQDNLSESLKLAYKIMNSYDFKNKNLLDLRMDNHLIINNE
jgi:cell division protein FtsQ